MIPATRALFGEDFRWLRCRRFVDAATRISVDRNEMRERTMRRVRFLRQRGLPKGAAVAVWTTAPLAFAENLLAVIDSGLVAVPVDPQQSGDEQLRRIELCGISTLLADRGWDADCGTDALRWVSEAGLTVLDTLGADAGGIAGRPPRSGQAALPAEAALILFTSGSTGASKAVVLTHANIVATVNGTVATGRFVAGDCVLGVSPLHHSYAIVQGLLAPLAANDDGIVSFGRFSSSAAIAAMDAYGITGMAGVPAVYEIMLRHPAIRSFSSRFRYATCGGGPVPKALQDRFRETLGAPMIGAYGITEATGLAATPPVDGRDYSEASIGWPIPGVSIRLRGEDGAISDIGEMEIGGPTVMAGYLGDAAATAAVLTDDGWLRTGDIVRRSEGGELVYVGRIKNLINRGGEKVHPETVEAAVATVAWVAAVAAVGCDDPILGERIVCLVEADPSDFDPAMLARECDRLLGRHERPDGYLRVAAIPRNANGKVDLQAARRLAATQTEAA